MARVGWEHGLTAWHARMHTCQVQALFRVGRTSLSHLGEGGEGGGGGLQAFEQR